MEPGIYLELTPAQSGGINLWDDKHAYLVYRKVNGDTEVIRGGPGFRSASRGRNGDLAIQVEVGKSLDQSKDKYEAGERSGSRPSRRLPIADDDLDKAWTGMRRKAEEIGAAGLSYRADTEADDPDQTSNSVVRAALDAAGVSFRAALPEGFKVEKLPGFEDNLQEKLKERQRAKERTDEGLQNDPMADVPHAAADRPVDHRAVVADLTRDDDPLEEILLKRPGELTEGEARQLAARRLASEDSIERQALFGFERAHYDDLYGAGPASLDATGRLVQPIAVKVQNQTPVAARGIDGRPVAETVAAVAEQVASLSEGAGRRDAVRALQRGLNVLIREPWRTPDHNPEVWRERLRKSGREDLYALFAGLQPLKDDGLSGPKTRAALRRAAAAWGRPGVKEGLALGWFDGFARHAATGATAGGLKTAAETVFAPLFPARAARPGGPRPEGYGLQMAVNDLGQETMGGAFRPLKEDGDIGPKTEAAFHDVLRAAGPDRFADQLGKRLGFFGAAGDAAEVA